MAVCTSFQKNTFLEANKQTKKQKEQAQTKCQPNDNKNVFFRKTVYKKCFRPKWQSFYHS